MKKIETYRRIAILLYKTNYKISIEDICSYLIAQHNFFDQREITTYDNKYYEKTTGLSKQIIKKIMKAEKEIYELHLETIEEYPLAKECAITDNAIHAMKQWDGFVEANVEIYNDAIDHINDVNYKILHECETEFAPECEDLLCDGKVIKGKEAEAIERYMAKNGFVPQGGKN